MIVVCGGSRPFDRLAVRHLLDRVPAAEITVIDHESGGHGDWYGVGVRSPGPDDSPILSSAMFAGAERVLFTAERAPRHLQSLADNAVAAGVRRIVFAGIADDNWPEWWLNDKIQSALESSYLASFVILRVNLPSEAIAPAIALAQRTGELAGASGDGLFASAAMTDCAEVAAAMVAGDGHDFQSYHLAGPIGLKPPGVAAIASRIAGRQIAVREVDPAELGGALSRSGADGAVVEELERVYRIIRSGGAHLPSDALAPLLGRTPLTVEMAVRAAIRTHLVG